MKNWGKISKEINQEPSNHLLSKKNNGIDQPQNKEKISKINQEKRKILTAKSDHRSILQAGQFPFPNP